MTELPPPPPRVLVSGGTGFVGRHLVPLMAGRGRRIAILTRVGRPTPDGVEAVHAVGDLALDTVAAAPFRGTDVLIHMAGHVMVGRQSVEAVEDSHNVRMARIVATRARDAGIPRILVLSSIAASVVERQPHLARRYGHEKRAADQVFCEMLDPAQRIVFIRPPAVYGPGMAGALGTLAGLIHRGLPLPFGLAQAPRDYISADNLCELLDRVATAPETTWGAAHGQAFAPSDGTPVPTNRLVRMMAGAIGSPARLVPVPLGLLRLAGRLAGRTEMVSGAIDGLEIADNAPLARIFGWTPHEQMPESLGFLKGGVD